MLEEMVQAESLNDFVVFVMKADDKEQAWEYYLHKVFDKSFDDFYESAKATINTSEMTEDDVDATIRQSMDITANFIPGERGENELNGII